MQVIVATVIRTMTVKSTIRSANLTVENEPARPESVSNVKRNNRAYVALTIEPFGLNFIGFLYRSIQTTERYLGCKQKLRVAVNDRLGIEPDAA
jgi:hypothetical protein